MIKLEVEDAEPVQRDGLDAVLLGDEGFVNLSAVDLKCDRAAAALELGVERPEVLPSAMEVGNQAVRKRVTEAAADLLLRSSM